MKHCKIPGSTCVIESLEDRRLLSAASSISLTLSATTAVLGTQVTATVTVSEPGSSAHPRGEVNIYDNGTLIGHGPDNKHGQIAGSLDSLNSATGGNAFFTGTNVFTAKYLGGSSFNSSRTRGVSVNITMPKLTTVRHSGGVQIATVVKGSGDATVAGDSATIAYTGYLTDGTIFDSSVEEGNSGLGTGDLTFTIDANPLTVVPGMNSGVNGMLINEVRVISIPAAEAYGSAGSGSVPPNANLIFVVGLISN